MSMDEFLLWCKDVLHLPVTPAPETSFRSDLLLDDLEVFDLVLKFYNVVDKHSAVDREVYERVGTIRDLYLYYLTITSMPEG